MVKQTRIRLPEKVLEDIQWNASHGKCRQCSALWSCIENGEIDVSNLDENLRQHLEDCIDARRPK